VDAFQPTKNNHKRSLLQYFVICSKHCKTMIVKAITARGCASTDENNHKRSLLRSLVIFSNTCASSCSEKPLGPIGLVRHPSPIMPKLQQAGLQAWFAGGANHGEVRARALRQKAVAELGAGSTVKAVEQLGFCWRGCVLHALGREPTQSERLRAD